MWSSVTSDTAAKAALAIRSGKDRTHFWIGGILVGHGLPLLAAIFGGPVWMAVGGVTAIVGMYYYEYVFVLAPQEIPNS